MKNGFCRIILGLAAAFGAGHRLYAEDSINIHFTGPGVAHMTYNGSATGIDGRDVQIQLILTIPSDGVTTVLDNQVGVDVSINGTRRDTGFVPGTQYRYHIRVRHKDEEDNWSGWSWIVSEWVHPVEHEASGTLLFDETLQDFDVSAKGVDVLQPDIFVPNGLSLTLNGVMSGKGWWEGNYTNILVHGTLSFGTGFEAKNATIVYASEISIDGIDAGTGGYTLTEGGSVANTENGRFVFVQTGSAQATDNARIMFLEEGEITEASGGTVWFYGNGQAQSSTGTTFYAMDGTEVDVLDCSDVNLSVRSNAYAMVSNCSDMNLIVHADASAVVSDSVLGGIEAGGTASRLVLDNNVTVIGSTSLSGGKTVTGSGIEFVGPVGVGGTDTQFKPVDIRFGNLILNNAGPDVVFTDCLIAGDVVIRGGNPVFTGCEFGEQVELRSQTEVAFTGCIFLSRIYFSSGSGDGAWSETIEKTPDISDNAFMGRTAISSGVQSFGEGAPIAIGPNYYGHEHGFLRPGGEFINSPGAVIFFSEQFDLAPALKAPPVSFPRRDRRVLPKFWANRVIYGQGTVHHTHGWSAQNICIKGQDSLLSVHLISSDNDVKGVRLYVEWDGKIIEANSPHRKNWPVHRNIERYVKSGIEAGVATFDFILPAVQSASQSGRVMLDYSGIPGYEPGAYPAEPEEVYSFDMTFQDPPPRPLRVAVVPVEITGLFGTWGEGNPAGVVQYLERYMHVMLPIPSSHIQVDRKPVHRVRSRTAAVQYAGLGVLNMLSARFAADRGMKSRSRMFGDTAPDFVVLVLPRAFVTNNRGQNIFEGLNFTSFWRNRVLFVAENHPDAVLHEMGHGIGLYVSGLIVNREQYAKYPDNGLPVQKASITYPQRTGRIAVHHLAGEKDFWHDGEKHVDPFYDVMGNVNPWALPETRQAFHDWFQDNLTASSIQGASQASGYSPQSEPFQRILLSGVVVDGHLDYVSIRNVSALDMDAVPPPEGIEIVLSARDAMGQEIYSKDFVAGDEDGVFLATFDVPENTASIVLHLFGDPDYIFYEMGHGGLTDATFVQPGDGATVSGDVEAQWNYTISGGTTNAAIVHSLFHRESDSDHWQSLAFETTATNLILSAALFTADTTPELLLVTSDGIHQVSNTVTFSVSAPVPTPPTIEIVSPLCGDVGDTNTYWALGATAVEGVGGSPSAPGEWRSSLDGDLGTGANIDVLLSPGSHELFYQVTGENNLTATSMVSVTVYETVLTMDLFLDEEHLSLANETIDPTGLSPEWLWPDAPNSFFLRIRNQGVEARIRVSMTLTPPDGATFSLGSQDHILSAFQERVIRFAFIPEAKGLHTARALLELLDPLTDPVLANNSIQLQFASSVRIDAHAEPEEAGGVGGDGLYGYKADAELWADPEWGYRFAGWYENGVIVSTQNPYSFTTDTSRAFTAAFLPEAAGEDYFTLSYSVGAGGVLSGGTFQIVDSGADGDPIEVISDTGTVFHGWSDGVIDNPRRDTNVQGNIAVTALFRSPGGAEIGWYTARRLTPAEDESWDDIDQQLVPGKGTTMIEENIADTDPYDPEDRLRIVAVDPGPPFKVYFEPGSIARVYDLIYNNDFEDVWQKDPEVDPQPGSGREQPGALLVYPNDNPDARFYRIRVRLP